MTPAQRLRSLLATSEILAAPGAYDALTAKLIEAAGFPVVYMTGYGTAASHGHADVGVLGLDDMAANAARIAAAVSVPVIADADTGYDDPAGTMRRYTTAGVAGIQLEDQAWPKKCGHMDGKVLVSVDEMVGRIRAAIAARGDADTVVVARTDAIAVEGFDAAIGRAVAYAHAGADLLFVEAPVSRDQVESIARKLRGLPPGPPGGLGDPGGCPRSPSDRRQQIPLVYNVAPKSPPIPLAELGQLGYALAIFPGVCFTETMLACHRALIDLKSSGTQQNLADWKHHFDEWNRFLGGDSRNP